MNEDLPQREVAVVAAVSSNNVIGNRGRIPWFIPEDLKRFKLITGGHTVIMGRKTLESLGRPLPNRNTVVLSRDPTYVPPHSKVRRASSLGDAIAHEDALSIFDYPARIYLVGGTEVFKQGLETYADTLYLTRIDGNWDGDTLFPEWDETLWTKVSEENLAYKCTLHKYIKRKVHES